MSGFVGEWVWWVDEFLAWEGVGVGNVLRLFQLFAQKKLAGIIPD